MKTIKIALLVLLQIGTLKLQAFELIPGEVKSDFTVDQTYKAEDNGLIYLQHNSLSNQFILELYIGNSPDSLNKVAEVRWFGTITPPIQKGK